MSLSLVVVENAGLLDAAKDAVGRFICDNYERSFGTLVNCSEIYQEYGVVNATESVAVADSCLSPSLLKIQSDPTLSSRAHANLCLSMANTAPLLPLQLNRETEDSKPEVDMALLRAYSFASP